MWSCVSNGDVRLVGRWEVNKMALSPWQLAVKYAFHSRITFLRAVTSTKTHYCLSYANFILSAKLAQKSWPCLLVCTTAASIGSLYCFFILPNPPFHFYILKYHLMEIVSPVIPALRRQSRFRQPELKLITWNRRKSSLEPSSYLQSRSENSHNCFFCWRSTIYWKSKLGCCTKSLTSWGFQVQYSLFLSHLLFTL